MNAKIKYHNFDLSFSDEDVVNPHDYWMEKWNLFLIHDHGFTMAVAIAETEQDAWDEAADSGKIDHFKLTDQDWIKDMSEDQISYLGNNGDPYDIEALDIVRINRPPFSMAALVNAAEYLEA